MVERTSGTWMKIFVTIVVSIVLVLLLSFRFGPPTDGMFIFYCLALIISVVPIGMSIVYLREQVKETREQIKETREHFISIETPIITVVPMPEHHKLIEIPESDKYGSNLSTNVGMTLKNLGKTAANKIEITLSCGYLYKQVNSADISVELKNPEYKKDIFPLSTLGPDDHYYLQWDAKEEGIEEIHKGNRYCIDLLVKYKDSKKRRCDPCTFTGYINKGVMIKSKTIVDPQNNIEFESTT